MYYIMIILPEYITYKIYINAILLKKKDNGWDDIHKFINKGRLCLKMTSFSIDKNIKYHKIERIISVIFYNEKPYIWLKLNDIYKFECYSYDSPTIRHRDVYCMDDFGNFFDDDIEYE